MTPETPSERAALVAWYMAHGMGLSTREVADLTHLNRRRAWELMCRISRIIPIFQDDDRVWRACPPTDTLDVIG